MSGEGCQVNLVGIPPSTGIVNTSILPSYSPLKAIVFPLGEKTGFDSIPSSIVSLLGFEPSLLAIHISSAYTNAICDELMAGCASILVSTGSIASEDKVEAQKKRMVEERKEIFFFIIYDWLRLNEFTRKGTDGFLRYSNI